MLLAVEDVGFGGLRVTVLDKHFFYDVLDFLNCGAAFFAEAVLKFNQYLVAYALWLLTVFSTHCSGSFPNGFCYTFLVEGF